MNNKLSNWGNMKVLFITIMLLPQFCVCIAQNYTYNYTPVCQKAYQQYMSLQLDAGNNYIKQAIRENPYNLMPVYIADYEDCLILLFNGSKADLAQRRGHLQQRLDLLDKADRAAPWYLLTKAGLQLHWALVYIRFGENVKAANLFRKSYNAIKENTRLYPNFKYNNVFLGMEQAAMGTIPDDFKWIAAMFGMKGDVNAGIKRLEQFLDQHNDDDILHREAVIFCCYLKFYLQYKQEDVWKFLNSAGFQVQGNPMHLFVKANIALNYRQAQVAINTLKQAQALPAWKQYPVFDYEMGNALLHKGDIQAVTYLKSYCSRFQGSLFVKDAWQKIAYSYYIQQNSGQAAYARTQIKGHGSTLVDADKQAQRFAEGTIWPDRQLLKVRMLIDGGYYKDAFSQLQDADPAAYSAPDRLEYYFRLARVYDELQDDIKALKYYRQVIKEGKDRKEHFAARATLQIAFMYEKAGNIPAAKVMYGNCLTMKGHDFQNSIDQQAKAGLDRLD